MVRVELRPFNDQQYNRDLVRLSAQSNTAAPAVTRWASFVLSGSRYALSGSKVCNKAKWPIRLCSFVYIPCNSFTDSLQWYRAGSTPE